MRPDISVVIPTHNHCRILPRTLQALGRQSVASDRFEVILVMDGCTDDSADVAKGLEVPYALSLVEQTPAGAAAARNRGAAIARAPILLFLDDDMEASARLVEAHLEVHASHPGGVVLGYFPLEVGEEEPDLHTLAVKNWWDRVFVKQADPAHRFSFLDFCTGNVSLPRDVFDAVGGFDPSFPGASTEDYELGVRLLKKHIRFRFSRDAASLHCDPPSYERTLRRAAGDGTGQVRLAQRHPDVVKVLKLAKPPVGIAAVFYWHLVWRVPARASFFAALFRLVMQSCRALGLSRLKWRFYGALDLHAYWKAVRSELGSLDAWRKLIRQAAREPREYRELEADLAKDLRRLEEILSETSVDGLVLRHGNKLLGKISPVPGAEPLRYPHVREQLIRRFADPLLRLLLLDSPGNERVRTLLGNGASLGQAQRSSAE